MSESPLRLVIVDPSAIFRGGLRSVLADLAGVEVVGEAADADTALSEVSASEPDIVLVEARLPDSSGVDLIRALLRARPQCRIVVLTWSEDELDLRAAVRAGAAGYLLKDLDPADLGEALATVSAGRPMVSPSLAPKLLSELASAVRRDAPRAEGTARLTERELEVLRHVARGMSNRAVAEALFLSENTVKNHVRNILEKLEAHSRMEAVLKASRAGLLQL